jgi:hypothetical protein
MMTSTLGSVASIGRAEEFFVLRKVEMEERNSSTIGIMRGWQTSAGSDSLQVRHAY